jgi:nucleoside-diphosphate-sugar epimerase
VAQTGRFEGRTAAVTGAGGFIGNAVTARLAVEGARVSGLDVAAPALNRIADAGAEPVLADVTDREALEAALDGIDLVVHTAAFVREWGEMEDFVRLNVGGTVNVLDGAERAGVERVVHISSVVVYGYHHPGVQDEDAHRRAYGNPYIDTKSSSDRIACERGAVVIRPGDVYGPGGTQWILRPVQMAKAGRLALAGRGDGVMLPVYVDDLVEAILLGLEKGEPGRAYTAWDGSAVTFDDYFNRIARMTGGPEVRHLPRPVLELAGAAMERWARLRGAPPEFTARAITFVDRRGTISTERIRSELGWEPQVTLEEGLRRTEEWLRGQGLL